jgi:hypothetical protein
VSKIFIIIGAAGMAPVQKITKHDRVQYIIMLFERRSPHPSALLSSQRDIAPRKAPVK